MATPTDPGQTLRSRLTLAAVCVVTLYLGVEAVWTRHFSSSSHGQSYSTDGAPAVAAGIILCVVGVATGAFALFQDSEFLNRRWGPRDKGDGPEAR